MKIFAISCLSCLFALTGAQADAALYYLSYSGNPFVETSGHGGFDAPDPFAGTVILDADPFGGSLAGKTVEFYGTGDFDEAIIPFLNLPSPLIEISPGVGLSGEGLVAWNMNIPLFSVAGTRVRFTFDADEQLRDWSISASDGPPNYGSSERGDYFGGFSDGDFVIEFRAAPGIWTVSTVPPASVVPLPASLALALTATGIGGLIALRRKTRRADALG